MLLTLREFFTYVDTLIPLVTVYATSHSRSAATLRRFLSQGPPAYRAFVEQRLRRTMLRGNREEPPTTLELKAAFTKKPIAVPVGFYTGSVTVNMDSQTTAAEIASAVWKNPLVTPEAGFSVYVTEKNLEQVSLSSCFESSSSLCETDDLCWARLEGDYGCGLYLRATSCKCQRRLAEHRTRMGCSTSKGGVLSLA